MKKIGLLCCILIFIAAVAGWINQNTDAQPEWKPPQVSRPAQTSTSESEGYASFEEKNDTITIDYPELRLHIRAQYHRHQFKTDQVPVLTAQVSQWYFEQFCQDFFLTRFSNQKIEQQQAQYPMIANGMDLDSETIKQKDWYAFDDKDCITGYIYLDEAGNLTFEDLDLSLNGGFGNNYTRYNLFTEESCDEFSQEDAVKRTTEKLSAYTDFDLYAFNIQKETDSQKGEEGYRIGIQLLYQNTPISLASQVRSVGIDVITQKTGIGYADGIFCFDEIQETEPCKIMDFEDALSTLVLQAPVLIPENYIWTVYQIQLEYFGEYRSSTPGVYTFRPVWTFYITDQYHMDQTVRFYADTGTICLGTGI